MVSPLFWLPLGFMAGVAATLLGASAEDGAHTQDRSPARAGTPETRAARLRRYNTALEPIASDASHAREIAQEPSFLKMVEVFADPAMPVGDVLDYALGTSWTLGAAAFTGLARRADGASAAPMVPRRLEGMAAWQIEYALAFLAACDPPLPVGAPFAGYRAWWDDNGHLTTAVTNYMTKVAERGLPIELGDRVRELSPSTQAELKAFLKKLRHPMADGLADGLLGADVPPAETPSDPAFLSGLGRFWAPSDADAPFPVERWQDGIADALKAMQRTPVRSLLVTGDALVGKTSFLRLMSERVSGDGWRVFEASGADLQAGQQYIGQLEARIRQLLDELGVGRRIIWYVPDLLALALSGTHQAQSASILDQILPALSTGRLVIWAEASPSSAARLLQLRPGLRRALEVVRLDALEPAETRPLAEALAKRLADETHHAFTPAMTDTAIEVARHYLTASALPGSALSLMRMAALRAKTADDAPLDGHDVLDTLSQLTGLPLSILDGSERIDLAEIEQFFSQRVIGQPEAVTSIVERITMLKSGLNDPMKPFGVFLFAGPTGTGKTELAKAIAEYLFGSIDRMIRLDMSEYQSPDSIAKIIGGPGMPPEADTLIARIRKQPFSLILLDELEKSSPLVWDLFLQVFDEGRLTDTYGQTADFRHCLIILTTNLGATSHQTSGLGFAPMQSGYTSEQVLRAIGQTFRPEFQNRLDKIIVFRPLTRENMRGILKKELGRLFERRGLKDRDWAVEWEASALEFILEKGFSPDMGARPLKRAIDQYVVAPLAAAIVERRAPEGEQFVFVRSDGRELQAEFVDPDGDGEPTPLDARSAQPSMSREPDAPATLSSIMLQPQCSTTEIELLAGRQAEIAARLASPEWKRLKSQLSEAINAAGFWSRADRHAVLARYELMDRLTVAADTAASLQERLSRGQRHPGRGARDLVARLGMQVYLVREGLRDIDDEAPPEVAVLVETALEGNQTDKDAAEAWRRTLVGMYRAWCRKRNMQLAELGPVTEGGPPVLLVAGFGAHRILAREAGLHVLEQSEVTTGPSRIAARVLFSPSPLGDLSKGQRRTAIAEAFAKAPRASQLVRRYRRGPSPLVRSADGSWRTGKVDAVLGGDFDILLQAGEDVAATAAVR
ncbi:MAG: AAA family ATPase [Hyphomicrobiaceae bacterium]